MRSLTADPRFRDPDLCSFLKFFRVFFSLLVFRFFFLDGCELGSLGAKKTTKMEAKVVPERRHFKENGTPPKRLDFYCSFNEIEK